VAGRAGVAHRRGGGSFRRRPGARVAPDALESYFTGKQLLVVLDNCEHVLDGAAPLAIELLAAGAGVRVLATSREPLNVPGEIQWTMPPMALD